MPRVVVTGLGVVAVLAGGVVHGLWPGRWEASDGPGAAAARLASVSGELGAVRGEPLDERDRAPAGAAGCLCRRHVNRWTGAAVTVYLLCGRPGPVAIHPPDACYWAAGYEVSTPARYTPPSPQPLSPSVGARGSR